MSFSENLVNLRKERKMSQEQLADMLDVTRQTVYKWESEQSYPEMNKLIEICEIFNVSLDDIVKNTINTDERIKKAADKEEYLANSKKNTIQTGIGVVIILLGVSLFLSILGYSKEDLSIGIGVAILLVFIACAVGLFIYSGCKYESYKEDIDLKTLEFSKEEKKEYVKKTSIQVSIGIGIILLDVACMIILILLQEDEKNVLFIVSGFLAILSGAVFTLITSYSPIQQIKDETFEETKGEKLVGKLCGAIMLSATAIFLLIGFMNESWSTSWIVFPIGGIICGIVSCIFGNDKK